MEKGRGQGRAQRRSEKRDMTLMPGMPTDQPIVVPDRRPGRVTAFADGTRRGVITAVAAGTLALVVVLAQVAALTAVVLSR